MYSFGDDPFTGGLKAVGKLATGHPKDAANALINGGTFGQVGLNGINDNSTLMDAGNALNNATFNKGGGADPNAQAGTDIEAVGNRGYEMSQAGLGRALENTIPAGRYWEDTWGEGGKLAGDTNSQKLYDDMDAGTDLYANRSRELGEQSIANSFGARGLQNSGAALKAVGNLNKDIAADQYARRASLAGQADTQQNTRFGQAFDRINDYTGRRADLIGNMTTNAVDNWTGGQLGGIQSRLDSATGKAKAKSDRNASRMTGVAAGASTGNPWLAAAGYFAPELMDAFS
jgi:hypothetical protein